MKDSQKPSAIRQYELKKKELLTLCLERESYMRAIKKIADKLGV